MPRRTERMDEQLRNSDLPVLMVFDLDESWEPHERAEVMADTGRLVAALRRRGHSVVPLPLTDADLPSLLAPYDPSRYVVFNWCEGLPGVDRSDHAVARALEDLNFTYTGATGDVLWLSRDKSKVKERLREHGLPVPDGCIAPVGCAAAWSRFPAIVKPAYEHSSMGMTSSSVVFTRAELSRQVRRVHRDFDQPAIIEDFIDGREFHVPLWGNGAIDMLPPVEMDFSDFADPQDRICSYDSKFVPESEGYRRIRALWPAPLGPDEMRRLQETSIAAYRAVGCRDYARVDLRMRDGEFVVLDVNPNADVSRDTSFDCAARVAGYSYGDLGSRIVRLAARRHPVLGTPEADAGRPPRRLARAQST